VIPLNDDLTLAARSEGTRLEPREYLAPQGQYLFLRPDGEFELWKLTPSGWFDSGGVHYDSPLKRSPKLTQWKRVVW
jgi:hypothetical protein